jgi:thiamine pyrophosphokinase
MFFQSDNGITLAGGAGFTRLQLQEALSFAPAIVAADGGANHLDRLGHLPDAVIGDLDSILPDLRAKLGERVHHVAEQDSTDLDKCLRSVAAPFVLGVGFLGARLDHTVAAMNALARHGTARVVLLSADDLCFLAPPELVLPLQTGRRVSLFPMGPVTGQSTGLEWPIDGLAFAPDARIGTSNRMKTDILHLSVTAPCMLVMLDRATLPEVLRAVTSQPDW